MGVEAEVRAIFTSDWQCEMDNVDLCQAANKEILAYCKEYDIDFVIHAGDLKRVYNPLDGRMVNAVSTMIGAATSGNRHWIQLLGNHDRFGLHTDKENWLRMLGNAGADVYEDAEVVSLTEGCNLALLP